MSAFVLARDRDAWAIFRGYAYQVDLTIERWLCLESEQELQLECGEDIDFISRAYQAGNDASRINEASRLLEQVKHRDSSVTLKSDEAVEAIANAVEHRSVNRGTKLFFRFTTNAHAGREQMSPLRGQAAIEVWNQIRSGDLDGDASASAIQSIRTLMRDRNTRPDRLNTDTWCHFRAFINEATDEDILDLILAFEWSTGAPAAADMATLIPNRLLSNHRARDRQEAVEQYYRLFLFVFKRLCESGRKVLTPEEREEQLRLPTLSAADSALLLGIRTDLGALDGRLTAVEKTIQVQQQAVNDLSEQVSNLALVGDGQAALTYTVIPPMLDLPPLVELFSRRSEATRGLVAEIRKHPWTAIHGSVGSGKSVLGALAAHELSSCRAWVRLRGLTSEQACRLLDEACSTLTGEPPQHNWGQWYTRLCHQLGRGSLLVLDDLPQIKSGDGLAERLLRLAQVCRNEGVHLLSTSNFLLPTGLQQRLHKQALAVLPCPPLTDAEAAEILQAHGAPLERLEAGFAATVNTFAQGHPQLLAAFTHYMGERGWRWTDEEFGTLLQSGYAEELNNETVGNLLDTVVEEQSRELLYRLNTTFGHFAQDTVQTLAAVDPVVERPRERLNRVVGLWVQQEAQAQFLVSPLIRALGTRGLPLERAHACHFALGDLIMRKGQLHLQDLSNAVTHFAAANAFDRAGGVLAWSLGQVHQHPDTEHANAAVGLRRLLSFWWDAELPPQMSLYLRLFLRAQQIVVGQQAGKDIAGPVASLRNLLPEATEEEASAVLAVVGVAGPALASHDFMLASRFSLRALELLPHARQPDGKPMEWPEGVPPTSLIWWNLTAIQCRQHVRDWLDMVDRIGPAQRVLAFSDDLTEDSCVMLADRVWMLEAEKPEEERRWQEVLETLQELAEAASRMNLVVLWACALRAQIIVLAEYEHDLSAALATARLTLEQCDADPRNLFLIKEATGRVCGYAGQTEEATLWLNQALTETAESYPLIRFRATLEAAWFCGAHDPRKAIAYVRQGVELARVTSDMPETEMIKALGELTIAHWLDGDSSAAFEAYDEAAERLLACREETDNWRGLFSVFGHVGGLLSSLAKHGHAPPETGDGEPYSPPARGYFLRYTPRMASSVYNEMRLLLLPEMIAIFAEGVGRDDRTAAWALKGIEMTRKAGQQALLVASVMTALPYLLVENKFIEALDAMYVTAPAFIASMREWHAGSDPLQADFDVNAVLGSKKDKGWQQAEELTAMQALLPVFLRISYLALNDFPFARTCSEEVSKACRQMSKNSVGPAFWISIADLLERIFMPGAAANTLIASGSHLFREGEVVAGIISLIGGTLQPNIELKDALGAHMTVAIYLSSKTFAMTSPMHRHMVLPFFMAYWNAAFRRSRFRFSAPRLVEQRLAEVANAPIDLQIKVLFRAIADGLGGHLPDWVQAWFSQESR